MNESHKNPLIYNEKKVYESPPLNKIIILLRGVSYLLLNIFYNDGVVNSFQILSYFFIRAIH